MTSQSPFLGSPTSFRAGDPVRKVAYEHEVSERHRQERESTEREDAEERAKRDEARREAFKRTPTRDAIRASIDELKGAAPDYAAKEEHRTESVRDSCAGHCRK